MSVKTYISIGEYIVLIFVLLRIFLETYNRTIRILVICLFSALINLCVFFNYSGRKYTHYDTELVTNISIVVQQL